MQEMQVLSLSQEDPLEKGTSTHSNILAWEIPWTGEPGRLQSTGPQSVGHDLKATKHTHSHTLTHTQYATGGMGLTPDSSIECPAPENQLNLTASQFPLFKLRYPYLLDLPPRTVVSVQCDNV